MESFKEIGTHNTPCTPADALTVQYISELMSQLVAGTLTESRKNIPQNPYTIDYIEKGDYQTAGDTTIYGFLFLEKKRRQQLTPKDYLHLASQSYLRWYARQPTSIGYLLSERVEQYLPIMQGVLQKVFPEVPPPTLRLV